MQAQTVPIVPRELVEYLEHVFPQTTIKPTTTTNAVMYNAGERAVVDWLQTMARNSEVEGYSRQR